jgi:dTDP-4-amino-4,6-dideoxy-D-galactose acyltransferase
MAQMDHSKNIFTWNAVDWSNSVRKLPFRLIQTCVSASNKDLINAYENLGFRYVDTALDYVASISETSQNGLAARIANLSDYEALRTIARTAFTNTRFFHPVIPIERSKEFYATWVLNSLNSTFDDCAICFGASPAIEGFVTLKKLSASSARIGLIASSHSVRGTGQRLIGESFRIARSWGCKELKVTTSITNIAAQKLYSKAGFQLREARFWLYYINQPND